MTNLSITLPNSIVEASNEAAKKLGVSRTAFIRQAVIHELNNLKVKSEEKEIIRSFDSIKKSKDYLKESESIINDFSSDLPNERDNWWND